MDYDKALTFYKISGATLKEFKVDARRLYRLGDSIDKCDNLQKILNDVLISLKCFEYSYVIEIIENSPNKNYIKSFLFFAGFPVDCYDTVFYTEICKSCKTGKTI